MKLLLAAFFTSLIIMIGSLGLAFEQLQIDTVSVITEGALSYNSAEPLTIKG